MWLLCQDEPTTWQVAVDRDRALGASALATFGSLEELPDAPREVALEAAERFLA